ncbi:MAG: alpha-ketoacid dehydrogenase subunit beta, partial [bacterium]
AEIAASVAQDLFAALRAPIRRLGAPRIPISYAPPLEDVVRVGVENIVAAARSLVEKEHA